MQDRLWYGFHKVHIEYLRNKQDLISLAGYYYEHFSASLNDNYPPNEFVEVSLSEFARGEIATRSIEMLFGPRLFELNPQLLDTFWEFGSNLLKLVSLPRWLAKDAHHAQLRFTGMVRRYLDDTFEYGGGAENDPRSGYNGPHKLPKMLVQWVRERGLTDESASGALSVLTFA